MDSWREVFSSPEPRPAASSENKVILAVVQGLMWKVQHLVSALGRHWQAHLGNLCRAEWGSLLSYCPGLQDVGTHTQKHLLIHMSDHGSSALQNLTFLTCLPESTYFKKTKERKNGPKSDLWLQRTLQLTYKVIRFSDKTLYDPEQLLRVCYKVHSVFSLSYFCGLHKRHVCQKPGTW